MDTFTNLTSPTRGTMSDLEDLIQQQRDRLGDLDDVASARMRAIYQSQAQAVMVQLERVTRRIDEACNFLICCLFDCTTLYFL